MVAEFGTSFYIQLQAQELLKSWANTKSWENVRWSVSFCSQSVGGVSICLLT